MTRQDGNDEPPVRILFERLWTESGARGNCNAVFTVLARNYGGFRRHYHTWDHVMWVLWRLEELTPNPSLEVRWAAWFHDAILEGRPDDELQSAELARSTLVKAGLGEEFAGRVFDLISATTHDAGELTGDAALLSDADIAILGASPGAFDEYEANVRKEWAHVSDEDFAAGRTAILRRFLDKPRIYFTEAGRRRWEEQARENLAYSIQRLESGKGEG